MYWNKNIEDLKKLEQLACFKNQVKEVRLQDRLGGQNYHQNAKNLYEPLPHTIKITSENLTKTITETYINNNNSNREFKRKIFKIDEW